MSNIDTAFLQEVEKQVLWEDNHLIIYSKRPGELVQGDKTGDEPIVDRLKKYLILKHQKPGEAFLGVIHRIDRPTSGLVVFAKTSKSLARMNALFHDREVDKVYWALVKLPPPASEGRLEHYLLKNQTKNKAMVFNRPQGNAKKAVMQYKLLKKLKDYFLLELRIETGRHHQIRAQLSAIGCPIQGDLKYGFPRSNPDGGISLHARSIEFLHPVKNEKVQIEAPVPAAGTWKYI